ncbi:unnamed protein product [Phytophthora lilii]|uniref:Unnamed protein product n=1 Tax=Phytophthora lilii TaxID=2077276 RepID=A0A9W7D897_9STRA|nr:unnamed protein product [Phytophthora lilii]
MNKVPAALVFDRSAFSFTATSLLEAKHQNTIGSSSAIPVCAFPPRFDHRADVVCIPKDWTGLPRAEFGWLEVDGLLEEKEKDALCAVSKLIILAVGARTGDSWPESSTKVCFLVKTGGSVGLSTTKLVDVPPDKPGQTPMPKELQIPSSLPCWELNI